MLLKFHDPSVNAPWVVGGGGIGGLAAALSLSRSGLDVLVLERAQKLSEIGAGIQLGPNAVAVLHQLGLWDEYRRVACLPGKLQAIDADTGQLLSTMDLTSFASRYGFPYTSVHRGDLQAILLRAAQARADVRVASEIYGLEQDKDDLLVYTNSADVSMQSIHAAALVGADGLWSRVRQHVITDGKPLFTGDVAYRALVPTRALPVALRSTNVRIWMGAHIHVVAYPVKAGEAMNIVAIISGRVTRDAESWEAQASGEQLADITRKADAGLAQLLEFGTQLHGWQAWALHVRKPISASRYVKGRVALLGDAAHPMVPYLAQGASMALEDAWQLGVSVRRTVDVENALKDYALARWQRNARVQQRALRNGEIFHLHGVKRWGRDMALRLMGPRLMDSPWLYGAARQVAGS
jgi:salicylate hydroxylase